MKKFFFLLLAASVTFTGCKKKEGCTNSLASNYCDDCEKDNGNCSYTGKFLYWWQQPFRDSCAYYGITSLKVYFEGQFVGSLPVSSQSWTAAPGCDATGTLTITKTWSSNVSKPYSVYYVIYHSTLGDIGSSTPEAYTLTGKGCNQQEITW